MKLRLLHSNPILLTLLPRQVFTVCLLYEINKGKASPWHPYFLHLPRSYSILATFGELKTQALQVDYAIWAAQKTVTKAKYEWEQAFTLMKELKFKPLLLTFRAWIWATGTALDLKPNYVRAWAGYQLRQPGLSFCWMHGSGLAEFMHCDDLFELIADLKSVHSIIILFYLYFVRFLV
ncbi:hypothetical protein V6Z12_A06G149100 [Gossypium hirsutum]